LQQDQEILSAAYLIPATGIWPVSHCNSLAQELTIVSAHFALAFTSNS